MSNFLNDPTIDDIDLPSWFGARKVPFVPPHFTRVRTTVTVESLNWIEDKLSGRYAIVNEVNKRNVWENLINIPTPAFEDPAEATLYELTWS